MTSYVLAPLYEHLVSRFYCTACLSYYSLENPLYGKPSLPGHETSRPNADNMIPMSSVSASQNGQASDNSSSFSAINLGLNSDRTRPQTCFERFRTRFINKGSIANSVTMTIMFIGLTIVLSLRDRFRDGNDDNDAAYKFGRYLLSFGLFGFAGGATNWLAIKMLFDRIPFVAGSGIIPRRFREIREAIRVTIMQTFFDQKYLEKYMNQKVGKLSATMNIGDKVAEIIKSDAVDKVLDEKLTDLGQRPEGLILSMNGLPPSDLKPIIKPFMANMAADVAPMLMNLVQPGNFLNADKVKSEVENLLTDRLEELSPEMVKRVLEEVIRSHLGWLIVWGNVFGGLIGLISEVAGYSDLACR